MRFRPCIDIHNGKIKQIVGASLRDKNDEAEENFVSEQDGSFYGAFYKKDKVMGGHIILLNPKESSYYEETKAQAFKALNAYPNGLQVGGGITPDNAKEFLDAGASHVIVTSYVFSNGEINYEHLEELLQVVGKERLVLDLSCRKRGDVYYIVTDRWQKFTQVEVNQKTLDYFSQYCDEFLVHAVDVEGKANGIEEELVCLLGNWDGIPITYAGGIGNFKDLEQLKKVGNNRLDVTIGSALDLFGGTMAYEDVLNWCTDTRERLCDLHNLSG